MGKRELVEKGKEWRKIAKEQDDFFVKFALEYFTFNALLRIVYFPNAEAVKDRDLINRLKSDHNCKNFVLKNENEGKWIKELKEELGRKPLQNLTRRREIKAEELEDFENIVEAIYCIRNNLFHGHKYPGDERDQQLVKIGYNLISEFNDYLLKRCNNGS